MRSVRPRNVAVHVFSRHVNIWIVRVKHNVNFAVHGPTYAWLFNSLMSIINTYKCDGDARGKIIPAREIGLCTLRFLFPTKMLRRPSKSH